MINDQAISESSDVFWWSEVDWVRLRGGLLIFLIKLDGLVGFTGDET